MLNAIMPSVVILSVVAPRKIPRTIGSEFASNYWPFLTSIFQDKNYNANMAICVKLFTAVIYEFS
jgi:hypothetical protein